MFFNQTVGARFIDNRERLLLLTVKKEEKTYNLIDHQYIYVDTCKYAIFNFISNSRESTDTDFSHITRRFDLFIFFSTVFLWYVNTIVERPLNSINVS